MHFSLDNVGKMLYTLTSAEKQVSGNCRMKRESGEKPLLPRNCKRMLLNLRHCPERSGWEGNPEIREPGDLPAIHYPSREGSASDLTPFPLGKGFSFQETPRPSPSLVG